jgi:signal transduction histidine kinase
VSTAPLAVAQAGAADTSSAADHRGGAIAPLAALALVALVATGLADARVAARSALHLVVAVVVVAWVVAGATAVRRGPWRLGWMLLWGAALAAGSSAAGLFGVATRSVPASSTRELAACCSLLAGAAAVHVLCSLPEGRLATTGRRVLVGVWYAAALGACGQVIAASRAPSTSLVAIGWGVALVTASPVAYGRYGSSSGEARQRLQWLGVGLVLGGEVGLVAGTLNLLVHWPAQVLAVAVGGSVLVPVALVLAMSPELLARGGRLLVHSLAALGITATVAAVYLVVVLGLGSRPNTTADREVLGLSILAAAIVAIGYLPIRDRLLHSATGLVYGAREAPDEVVRTFGSRLTRAIPMDELLLQLAESLRKTLALHSAEVYTGTGEVLELTVSVPDQRRQPLVVSARERPVVAAAGVSGNAWVAVWLPALLEDRDAGALRAAPISHGGELLGLIVVQRQVGASAFSEEDDRVLTELARQVGLAFHNAQLDTALQTSLDELRRQADELRASRARIVAASDATRRRVERDLHDGAQQHLVALAVNLRLARDIVLEDPPGAAEMLGELATAVQDTIQQLRELAHGIYPPLLVDSGLREALRAVCNRSPLDVELDCEGIGRYDGDIEAAIYFCCLEALQNAAKHAPSARVVVRVWEDAGGLLFEVSDDGPGFDVRLARRGHGFVNMSDRLGAIGGSIRWESTPGEGTTIAGSVPIQ